jgi:hypothetical protein
VQGSATPDGGALGQPAPRRADSRVGRSATRANWPRFTISALWSILRTSSAIRAGVSRSGRIATKKERNRYGLNSIGQPLPARAAKRWRRLWRRSYRGRDFPDRFCGRNSLVVSQEEAIAGAARSRNSGRLADVAWRVFEGDLALGQAASQSHITACPFLLRTACASSVPVESSHTANAAMLGQ